MTDLNRSSAKSARRLGAADSWRGLPAEGVDIDEGIELTCRHLEATGAV